MIPQDFRLFSKPGGHNSMSAPADPIQDPSRLKAVAETHLLDSAPEEAFDRLTRLAARILDVPVVLISLVDSDRQFFKSVQGSPGALELPRQTPLSYSFCKHVVTTREPLVVEDARVHALVRENPAIGLGVIAYAGIPLVNSQGLVLGSFCAIDSKPHDWSEDQIDLLRDLTAAAVTEIELRRTNEQLRRANQAKDQFFAMLSHELRTPLSPALLTATHLDADSNFPDRYREEIQLIHRNIDLEVRMIDSLFDLTRIQSGKLTLHTELVNTADTLGSSVSMCASEAAAKSIILQLDLHADRSVVRADSAKLQQVFCNLIKNSIKFGNPGDTIRLRSRDEPGDWLVIEVTDTGLGISPELLPNIFDAFEQGKQAITENFGGLGLGLAICKGIIEAHGGTIRAASAGVGKGAKMTVRIPGAMLPQKIDATVGSPADPARPRKLGILLVEDHEDTLRAMSRLLRKLEHRVTTATCVSGAIQAADNEKFDLVISDLGLPDGTGLELMEQLRAMYPLKGIALTGYGMESDIEKTKLAGFQMHLTKPINFGDLQAAIEELD